MAYKIGFEVEYPENKSAESTLTVPQTNNPRRSLVQVYFPARNASYTYYNDSYDLKKGDMVYVDGKLEGLLGRVTDVNYNFKIKISDYKRVIALVNTNVSGRFYMAGSHFVTFDPMALPAEKARSWFKAPAKEEDEFVSGRDDTVFLLNDLKGINISGAAAERGHDYYLENRVKYVCVDGTCGYAIVEGREAYEVEFEYRNGEISGLVCSCFCSQNCKHVFAAMLQLKETLDLIEKHYTEEYRSGYFAAVCKGTMFTKAIDGKETGSFVL